MTDGARLLDIRLSSAALAIEQTLRRTPRQPRRPRPPAFHEQFDDLVLAYDTFWHADGERVLMIGPPAGGLERAYRQARFAALPSGTPLEPRFHASLSVMITALGSVPSGTEAIEMILGDQQWTLPVQPNEAPEFGGRRLLFTLNKDNDLTWIDLWARYHVRRHGTDAIVLFDNCSTRYRRSDIEAVLRGIDGLAVAAVVSLPFRYGPVDSVLKVYPYWSRFLQIGAMSVVLRRCAARAEGLLNADIDELVSWRPGEPTIYQAARTARQGLVSYTGRWIESVAPEPRPAHGAFGLRLKDPACALCRPRKWALDPSRRWLGDLSVHPYMHWIEGRPLLGKSSPKGLFYWHFRGINQNWKVDRTTPRTEDLNRLERDPVLAAALESLP